MRRRHSPAHLPNPRHRQGEGAGRFIAIRRHTRHRRHSLRPPRAQARQGTRLPGHPLMRGQPPRQPLLPTLWRDARGLDRP